MHVICGYLLVGPAGRSCYPRPAGPPSSLHHCEFEVDVRAHDNYAKLQQKKLKFAYVGLHSWNMTKMGLARPRGRSEQPGTAGRRPNGCELQKAGSGHGNARTLIGADLDRFDEHTYDGATPFTIAAQKGHLAVARCFFLGSRSSTLI
jgi:hypothetical protein